MSQVFLQINGLHSELIRTYDFLLDVSHGIAASGADGDSFGEIVHTSSIGNISVSVGPTGTLRHLPSTGPGRCQADTPPWCLRTCPSNDLMNY